MKHEFSKRVSNIKELVFRRLDSLRIQDPDFIDLSRGLPQGLPPREVISEITLRLKYAENHIYDGERGLKKLREEVAYFYKDRYDVVLDPETEVQILMGGKDGIATAAQACLNPGDFAIVPDPSFPVFANSVILAGATPTMLKLNEKSGYVPTDDDLKKCLKPGTKFMYVNYPHNPTGASCTLNDFERFVKFGIENNIIVFYDAAYRDISFTKHPTMMQAKDAKVCGVEVGSLSKTFDMVGWRMAYMVGNKDIIEHVRKVKSVIDVGQFVPIQYSAALALRMTSYIDEVANRYKVKMEKALKILRDKGYEPFNTNAGFFIWIKLPSGYKSSEEYIRKVWEAKKLLLMPGTGFGENGEGFFRVSTTSPMENIEKGLARLDKIN